MPQFGNHSNPCESTSASAAEAVIDHQGRAASPVSQFGAQQRCLGHRKVPFRLGNGVRYIDEKIALLVKELWTAHFMTESSCQEERAGVVHIQFVHANAAAGFLNVVSGHGNGDRSFGELTVKLYREGNAPPLAWTYEVASEVFDLSAAYNHKMLTFLTSIRFPIADYPVVLQRMIDYNKGWSKA